MIRSLPTLAVMAVAMTGAAQAASFNCADAHKPTEVLICQDSTLSPLDEANAAIYYGLSNGVALRYRPMLAQYERDWLVTRNACGYDRQCILDEYWRHIVYLCQTADASGVVLEACQEDPE